jgi:anti-sigma regulatory factor (Ser/Thr protein kinase)
VVVSETFLPAPAQVGAARHFARSVAADLGCEADDLELVVSELATNACMHACSPFTLSLTRQGPRVLVEVADEVSPAAVMLRPSDDGATTGRGLHIVECVALAWGVRRFEPHGKAVWAELDCLRPVSASGPVSSGDPPSSRRSAIPLHH